MLKLTGQKEGGKRKVRNTKDNKPPSTVEVRFFTIDGKTHRGFFLKDANKFVRNVNRWKDKNTNKWYDDDLVTDWEYTYS